MIAEVSSDFCHFDICYEPIQFFFDVGECVSGIAFHFS